MPEADYEYLIENFGEEKILNRFVFIRDRAIDFLKRISKDHNITFDDYFFVSDELIEEAVIDYFADLVRLKDFHNIEKAQPHLSISFLMKEREPTIRTLSMEFSEI